MLTDSSGSCDAGRRFKLDFPSWTFSIGSDHRRLKFHKSLNYNTCIIGVIVCMCAGVCACVFAGQGTRFETVPVRR